MTEAQIKAQEAKDFKDRQAKRARAKVTNIEVFRACVLGGSGSYAHTKLNN